LSRSTQKLLFPGRKKVFCADKKTKAQEKLRGVVPGKFFAGVGF
jgi:hypothetical protein